MEETIYPINVATPTFMRAPGECPGTYALECAMDELAIALKMDPVALRVANHADNHPEKDVPFSAKFLKEAYEVGAEKFGWSKRNAQPGSMKDGDLLVGWGMATATYPAHKMSAAAKADLARERNRHRCNARRTISAPALTPRSRKFPRSSSAFHSSK